MNLLLDFMAQFNADVLTQTDSLIVDRKTGCYFQGEKLLHTEACECGDVY